jgi:hypothetical protein
MVQSPHKAVGPPLVNHHSDDHLIIVTKSILSVLPPQIWILQSFLTRNDIIDHMLMALHMDKQNQNLSSI